MNDLRRFIEDARSALNYKTEQTQDDKLRRLYRSVLFEGRQEALAELGEAVVGGRVFGTGLTSLDKALAKALEDQEAVE